MSLAPSRDRLRLPEGLQEQLHDFRRRVWSIKLIESTCASIFGIVLAFLILFAIDRVWDTPGWVRISLFIAALVGCTTIPLAVYRWIWRNRRPEQLARLLGRKQSNMGDQLLGVIELVDNEFEQARSRALCEAAIAQVAEDAGKRDFREAVPNPRHRQWMAAAASGIGIAAVLLVMFHDAATNALGRLALPWRAIPRYTFAAVEPLPGRLVVAHGEPFTIQARLTGKTVWRPKQGTVELDANRLISGKLVDGKYVFAMPSQIDPGWARVRIGDSTHLIHVEPMMRPELTSIVADVTLPAYLGRPGVQRKDVRGGSISLVKDSRVRFSATASRPLLGSQVDGKSIAPSGATTTSPETVVTATGRMEFAWRDEFGLAGKAPFSLNILAREDEPPALTCEDLPRQKVVLDSETLSFKVRAQDDFGVKRVGFEWQGVYDPVSRSPATGERTLAAGGFDKELMQVAGTFSAKKLGIEPQQINVRVFVEDYFPGRGRVFSPTYTFYILNAEQHAIWLTEQLSKWHRQSLEVRDREMQLFETNKQLRALPSEELDQPETRRRIENQAAAERANGRRLTNLVGSGEDLIRQASRNPEFGVGHLEKWAEMLQILKDISGNRMPSVADLLKQAAQAPAVALASQSNNAPKAGQDRAPAGGKPGSSEEGPRKPPTAVPTVSDRESSMLSPDKKKAEESESKSKPKDPMLRLPVTTLLGGGTKKKSDEDPESPAAPKVDEAVKKQQDLLAEFEKIAEELNRVLANLEGSTLVKRLKAQSRVQTGVAGRLSDHLTDTFGVATGRYAGKAGKVVEEMSAQESKGSHDVSLIMDDLQSYYERRQYMQFKAVLDEMRKQDVIGGLRQLGDDIRKENGVSMAQCEFWSDTLDRWAEDLVDPTSSGKCPGCKSKGSLPPSIVLEVLQILEAEINLREDTRVAQQARGALTSDDFNKQARKLADAQKELQDRVEQVNLRIHEIPDSEADFAYEMGLLAKVADVMGEAEEILARPETGNPAMAAETEAIELLLKSKRINPKGGGGGGPSPGGGGGGTTTDSALALLGTGVNQKEVREDHAISQSTGETGPSLPEEFRAGLDEYFNRLERRPAGK